MVITRPAARGPRPGPVALAAAIAVLVAACASGASGPGPGATYSRAQYGIAITQCAIDRGLVPDKYWKAEAAAQHWLVNGRIIGNFDFSQWWNANKGVIVVAGQTLSEWQIMAYSRQHVPTEVCGSTVMPTPVPSP